MLRFGMTLRPEYRSEDPGFLRGIILDRDAEIERLKTSIKTLNDLIQGKRSEKACTILDDQGQLDFGDLQTDVSQAAANDDEPAASSGTPPQKKAQRNIGSCRSIFRGSLRSSNRRSLRVPAARATSSYRRGPVRGAGWGAGDSTRALHGSP